MEKVKVTKEVAEALAGALAKFDGDKGELLQTHARTKTAPGINWHSYLFAGTNAPLDDLSTDEMARALYVGYEIAKLPAEIIRAKFDVQHDIHTDLYIDDKTETKEFGYADGYMDAIKDFAEVYGIKIEGVNA